MITIGWAKGGSGSGGVSEGQREFDAQLAGATSAAFKTDHPLDLTPPSADSKLLFVGGLTPVATVDSILAVLPVTPLSVMTVYIYPLPVMTIYMSPP